MVHSIFQACQQFNSPGPLCVTGGIQTDSFEWKDVPTPELLRVQRGQTSSHFADVFVPEFGMRADKLLHHGDTIRIIDHFDNHAS